MNKQPIIETLLLSAGYGKGESTTVVVDNLSFSLYEGEFALLLGCNGAGKSTLLRTISNVQKPLSGEVKICGENIENISPRELAQKISAVFTDKTMAGGLKVEEVVALGRHPYTGFFGKITKEDKEIIMSVLSLVGMGQKSKKYLSQLSDGERQKVMIAKALAQQTPLMILDEPTAFLDLPSRVEILYLLRRLADEQGKAILLSTHDVEQSLSVADKLLLFGDSDRVEFMPTQVAIENGAIDNLFISRGIEFNKQTGRFLPKQMI